MINKALFSSEKSEWETPQELFGELNREFDFILDPCATHDNKKCTLYFTKEEDGLKHCWYEKILPACQYYGEDKNVFVNPPYGRGITEKWVMKAWLESKQQGITVVMLLPSRTDQWAGPCPASRCASWTKRASMCRQARSVRSSTGAERS